jgi:hypothetical protein
LELNVVLVNVFQAACDFSKEYKLAKTSLERKKLPIFRFSSSRRIDWY